MLAVMEPKKDVPVDDTTTIKTTRKTAKLLMVLQTWSEYESVADYCTDTIDGILEERFAKIVEAGAPRKAKERSIPNLGQPLSTVRVTRKTRRFLKSLSTWTDCGSIAEYCEKYLDGILEERFAKLTQSDKKKK